MKPPLLVLLACLLAGCATPDNPYGLTWAVGTVAVTASDAVTDALTPHVYAAPGTTYPDFVAAIGEAEKISHVPVVPQGGPNFAVDHALLVKYEGKKAIYYGRFVTETNAPSPSVSAFSAGEITNLASIVARLQTPTDPVSAYLLSRFSESNRLAIARLPASGLDEKTVEPILIQELNAIVLGPSIYDADRFRGVTLHPATLAILQFSRKNPPATGLRYQQRQAALNRLLLADAFPANLPVKPWRPLQNLVAIKY